MRSGVEEMMNALATVAQGSQDDGAVHAVPEVSTDSTSFSHSFGLIIPAYSFHIPCIQGVEDVLVQK